MNFEKYTQKSMEAIREAQNCAIRNQNMQIDQQHLLYALLNQEDGAAAQILKKAKIDGKRMASACDRESQRVVDPRIRIDPDRNHILYHHISTSLPS